MPCQEVGAKPHGISPLSSCAIEEETQGVSKRARVSLSPDCRSNKPINAENTQHIVAGARPFSFMDSLHKRNLTIFEHFIFSGQDFSQLDIEGRLMQIENSFADELSGSKGRSTEDRISNVRNVVKKKVAYVEESKFDRSFPEKLLRVRVADIHVDLG